MSACLFQIWNERRLVRRTEVASATARANEAAGIRACGLRREYAVSCRTRDIGNEHGTVVHEGAGQSNARPPGKQ